MVECGKERLVRDGDPPRPVEKVRDARIMHHVVHEPALYHHMHGALNRRDAMWRRSCCCPPASVRSDTIQSAICYVRLLYLFMYGFYILLYYFAKMIGNTYAKYYKY